MRLNSMMPDAQLQGIWHEIAEEVAAYKVAGSTADNDPEMALICRDLHQVEAELAKRGIATHREMGVAREQMERDIRRAVTA